MSRSTVFGGRFRVFQFSTTLLALTTLLLVTVNSVVGLEDDFDFDVSEDFEVEFPPQDASLRHHPKNTDHLALANRVFKLTVPKTSSTPTSSSDIGTVKYYESRIDQDKPLPPWLLFDKTDGIFWGVPLESDVGTFHVTVRAIGGTDSSSALAAYDFKLTVKEGTRDDNPEVCPHNEDITLLTLIVDRASKAVKPKQRVIAINNVAKFFDIPYYNFTLKSQTQIDDITDSSVILAGPGNLKARSSKLSTLIEVPVGCEGRLWLKSAPIVHQLKQQARDGTISEVLRLPLAGWRVKTETRSLLRRKRHEDAYTGSGDYEYYEYEEEYDDPNEEDTQESTSTTSTTTSTTTTTTTTSTASPETQPAITEKPVTIPITSEKSTYLDSVSPTHPHRHHHGESKPLDDNSLEEDSIEPALTTHAKHPEIVSSPKYTFVEQTSQTTPSITNVPLVTIKTISPVSSKKTTSVEIERNKPEVSTQMTGLYKPSETFGTEEEYDDEYEDGDDAESETEVPFNSDVLPFTPNAGKSSVHEIIEDLDTTVIETITTPKTFTSTESIQPITTAQLVPVETVSTVEKVTSEEPSQEITIPIQPTTSEEPITVTTAVTIPAFPSTETVAENVTHEETTHTTTTRHTSSTTIVTHQPTFTTSIPHEVTDEKIIYEVKNFAPTVQLRLNRIAVTAGKNFSQIVPENMFSDMEDGTNLRLEFLDKDGAAVRANSWCQFNPRTREIYGLPLKEDISGWDFYLRATDKEGASVSEKVEIIVQQNKYWRVVNHEFTLFARIERRHAFSYPVDWALHFLEGIALTIGDVNASSKITVQNVDYTRDPMIFTWTNDSLNTNYCPNEEISSLYKTLTSSAEDGDPSLLLIENLLPEATAKKVTRNLKGVCEVVELPHPPVSTTSTPSHLPPVRPPANLPPILRNPVDHINATVGQLLVYRVPDDTFYDPEDFDPRNLKLHLYTLNKKDIPGDHWLQFDSKNKEFYGVPTTRDARRLQYQLVCEDTGGLTSSDTLVVEIHPASKLKYNLEFSMTIETDYESFARNAAAKRKFVEKLKKLFEDESTDNVHLSVPTKGGKDSTIVTWYNNSLSRDVCPWEEISRLESLLVNKDRVISNRVHHIMGEDFVVSAFRIQHLGVCRRSPVVDKPREPVLPPVGADEAGAARDSHDDYLLTFIVPAVIISLMLLLAGIAACVMYRRRRSGKMNLEEDGRQSYGNKGIPVIFQEELDEKPESGTKTPVILKDERPPLAPPEYSKSGGSLKLSDDSEPYQPPPPFARNQDNGRQPRPKPTPTYRKPPPYVPP